MRPTTSSTITAAITALLLAPLLGCDSDTRFVQQTPTECQTISASEGGSIGDPQSSVDVDVPPGALDEDTEMCIEYIDPPVDPGPRSPARRST